MDVEPQPLNSVPEGVAMAFAERFEHEAIGQVAAPVQEKTRLGLTYEGMIKELLRACWLGT